MSHEFCLGEQIRKKEDDPQSSSCPKRERERETVTTRAKKQPRHFSDVVVVVTNRETKRKRRATRILFEKRVREKGTESLRSCKKITGEGNGMVVASSCFIQATSSRNDRKRLLLLLLFSPLSSLSAWTGSETVIVVSLSTIVPWGNHVWQTGTTGWVAVSHELPNKDSFLMWREKGRPCDVIAHTIYHNEGIWYSTLRATSDLEIHRTWGNSFID